jgi:hypothetical protein
MLDHVRVGLAQAVLAAAAGIHAGAAEPVQEVRIGGGCIELPASHRVIETPARVVDQTYGRILAAGRPDVEWSFGIREAQPVCRSACLVLERWTELLGEKERAVGLLDDAGVRAWFVIDVLISFRVNDDSEAALSHLREVAAGYHRREHPERCASPEPASPVD